MYRNLLVPLDGSPFAEHALPVATTIARRCGAALQLVRVHVPAAPPFSGGELAADCVLELTLREQDRLYLGEVVKRVSAASSVQPTARLLDGSPADAIHVDAVATGADLVVMATHGRGPLSRFWLGSVADELIRRLPMPILLIRPKEGAAKLGDEASLRHIVIALDGSKLAEQILAPALALGSIMHADFTLVFAIEPVVVPATLGGNAPSGADPEVVQDAQAYLDQTAESLRQQGLVVQTRLVVNQLAAAAILDEAHARAADLIALATHGRSGFTRLLLGSVADKVVRGATGAVLVHRPSA
jgi:nucleotide-binding universal stress UspA family protein